ncbi:DUF3850 domain-containing protein [Grimontia marina]|uniref:DUF3850 domain-containing protein n=1 Tax=Grimontia marina TaxID=646534 RepID=A0A128EYB5_9GAMM|nr:DUF3850 domain-containing protein [Grimontia marina]CZF79487.1 hypothetical protein GMA8713_00996 [Grimontia marina]
MKNHMLKIEAQFLTAVLAGKKPFEIRKNDRGYEVGDLVMMSDGSRWAKGKIGYITDYAQKPGYVVFSLEDISGGGV